MLCVCDKTSPYDCVMYEACGCYVCDKTSLYDCVMYEACGCYV